MVKRERRQIENVGVTATEPDNEGGFDSTKVFLHINCSQYFVKYRHIWITHSKEAENRSVIRVQFVQHIESFAKNKFSFIKLVFLRCTVYLPSRRYKINWSFNNYQNVYNYRINLIVMKAFIFSVNYQLSSWRNVSNLIPWQ